MHRKRNDGLQPKGGAVQKSQDNHLPMCFDIRLGKRRPSRNPKQNLVREARCNEKINKRETTALSPHYFNCELIGHQGAGAIAIKLEARKKPFNHHSLGRSLTRVARTDTNNSAERCAGQSVERCPQALRNKPGPKCRKEGKCRKSEKQS